VYKAEVGQGPDMGELTDSRLIVHGACKYEPFARTITAWAQEEAAWSVEGQGMVGI